MTVEPAARLAIRNATPGDRTAMLDLWVEAWSQVRPEIDFADRRAWLDHHLDALLESGARIFVCTMAADRLAGFATVDPESGQIDQLVTSVWAQRQGVGRRLLDHARRLSPGGLALSVNQFNAPAIQLYERAGFERVGEGISAASGLAVWHMRWPGLTKEHTRARSRIHP